MLFKYWVKLITLLDASEKRRINMKCDSCGSSISAMDRYTKFKCPSCSKQEITRCQACKIRSNKYNCGCGFEGP